MSTSKVEFEGHDGSRLAARLDVPVVPLRAYALFAHCFTCSKDILAASRISAALGAHGIAVLRFDFTGLGMSEGEFANTNFSSNVADLVRAADYLRAHHQAPALLVGHSLGGAAVLAAARSIPEARAVATLGAPAEPVHVATRLGPAVDTLKNSAEADAEVEVTLAGRSFRIRRQFLDDLDEQNLRAQIAGLGRALLVMHSPRDEIVGIDNARRIFEAAQHPKSFVALDGAGHLLERREDAIYAATMLAAWASRYLPPAAGDVPTDEGQVIVREASGGRLANRVRAGHHVLIADEPASAGGDDAGPTPYDYLLAALGACTSMTLRLYARRKNWAVERIGVGLRQRSVHAQDCADCESSVGRVLQIDRTIELHGMSDPAQRARLLEIADLCPVHRALKGEISIRTRLDEAPAANAGADA